MIVGICEFEIILFESSSLKDKRQVVQSMCQRVKAKYPVSIAEVGYLEKWQRSALGFSLVSNDSIFVEKVMAKVLDLFEEDHRFEVTAIKKDIEKVSWE